MKFMILSIIIPVYNEKSTIKDILFAVKNVNILDIEKEIIIIDDFSTDGTREVLQELEKENKYKIFYQEKNQGKGSAVQKGFLKCFGDYIIIQDSDLEYNPNEYKNLLAPLIEKKADVVYGSRFMGGEAHRVLYFWHYLANKFLTTLSNIFTNLNLTDMETCYKAFNRKALDSIKNKLTAKRFGIEPEITALVAKKKLRVYEVGISYSGRTYGEGKKINWKDGLAAIWHIIGYNLFNKR